MFVQVALESKRLVASLALVVLEWWMGLHVSPKIWPVCNYKRWCVQMGRSPICKGLSTVSTSKGFVPSVGSEVSLEEPRPRECLAANPASGFLGRGSPTCTCGRGCGWARASTGPACWRTFSHKPCTSLHCLNPAFCESANGNLK